MSWDDHHAAFPGAGRLTCTPTYTPPHAWFTALLAIGSVHHRTGLKGPGGVTRLAITIPRAPLPRWGVTPRRVVCPQPRPALADPLRSYGFMCQTPSLSRPTHGGLARESWQVAAYPCWAEALPDVISLIGVEVLGPVPRRASSVQLPVASRRTSASPDMQQVQRAGIAAMLATSMTKQFRGCRHSVMFRLPHSLRPPGCSSRRSATSSAQPGRVRHAMPM